MKAYIITDCYNNDMGDIYKVYATKELAEEDLRRNRHSLTNYSVIEIEFVSSEDELRIDMPKTIIVPCQFHIKYTRFNVEISDLVIFSPSTQESNDDIDVNNPVKVGCFLHQEQTTVSFQYYIPFHEVKDMDSYEERKYVEEQISQKFKNEQVFKKLQEAIMSIRRITLRNVTNDDGTMKIETIMYLDTDDYEKKYGMIVARLLDGITHDFCNTLNNKVNYLCAKHLNYKYDDDMRKRIIYEINQYLNQYELGGDLNNLKPCFAYWLTHEKLP